MDTDKLALINERLDRLEANNRMWKRISFGLLCTVALVAVTATNLVRAPREISAEKFILKDRTGQQRALLAMGEFGSPTLSLLDRTGQDQVVLKAKPDGSSALEYFDKGVLQLSAASQKGVGSFVSLLNRARRTRSEMYLYSDGTAGIEATRDRRGVSMQVKADGHSNLGFADKKGNERFGIGLSLDGTVNLHDDSRKSADDHLSVVPEQSIGSPNPEPDPAPVATSTSES